MKTQQDSAKESYADESYTLKEDQLYSSLSSDVADWLFDASRTEGDTTYIANDSGVYYVLYYISRSTNDYLLPNVRHILISVSDTSDETAMEEARAKADEILAEFNAGDQDGGKASVSWPRRIPAIPTATRAVCMRTFMPGQMVTEFNDWCFDESRQPGDTGIVETSYGVHVMYFDGFGNSYRDTLVENALRTADYNAWHDGVVGDNAYTTVPFGMKFTTK